jgi:spermidine/putrescine-binding protein
VQAWVCLLKLAFEDFVVSEMKVHQYQVSLVQVSYHFLLDAVKQTLYDAVLEKKWRSMSKIFRAYASFLSQYNQHFVDNHKRRLLH